MPAEDSLTVKREKELGAIALHWYRRLEQALLRVENAKRLEMDMPVFRVDTKVRLPLLADSAFKFLNLRVWCLRYYVSPEFVLERLTFLYKKHRRCHSNEVRLGLPASLIAGPTSRKFIEEEVKRFYPNGENVRLLVQSMQNTPIKIGMEPKSIEDFIRRYGRRIRSRRKTAEDREEQKAKTKGRVYRKEIIRGDL